MTPETWRAIREEWKQELPKIINGHDRTLRHWAKRVKRQPAKRITDVISAVSIETGVPVATIMGDQKADSIVRVRHIAIYAAKQRFPGKSLGQLANAFKRDHTTIMHAVKRFPKRLNDPLVRRCYERVMASVT